MVAARPATPGSTQAGPTERLVPSRSLPVLSDIPAGLDGIQNKLTLPAPRQRDPGSLTDEERETLGVELLPTSVPEALGELEQDEVLKNALGDEYYKVYSAMRRFGHEERGDYDLEKERILLLTRY